MIDDIKGPDPLGGQYVTKVGTRTVRAYLVDEDSLDSMGVWQNDTTLFTALASLFIGAAISAGLTLLTASVEAEAMGILKASTLLLVLFGLYMGGARCAVLPQVRKEGGQNQEGNQASRLNAQRS